MATSTPAAPTSAPAHARGRTSALNLDDLFLFMTAASAALPMGVATVKQMVAALEPSAAVAVAPERPLVAVPGAHARYATLIESYDRMITSIVGRVARRMGLTRSTFLAREDVEQEVRLDLWKQVARGQTIDFPATYIYKATIRETLRAARRQAVRDSMAADPSGATEVADGADPFRVLAAKEQFRQIILAMRNLTPDRQSAVRAHLVGFAFNEIMSQFGWSYQRTRNLISRGMADLRTSLYEKAEITREARRTLELVNQASRAVRTLRRTARALRGL